MPRARRAIIGVNNSMRRLVTAILISALAITSILLAQGSSSATLRLQAGDTPITVLEQPEGVYFPLDRVVGGVGGTVTRDGAGFLVSVGSVTGAISPESRFVVIGDDLVELSHAPVLADGRAWVPIDFFNVVLGRSLTLEPRWDPATRILELRSAQVRPVPVSASVVDLEDFTKVVLQFETPVRFSHEKGQGKIRILLSHPPAPPASPAIARSRNVQAIAYGPRDVLITLAEPGLVADVYQIEEPFRIVVDVRKPAVASQPPTPADSAPRPVDLPGVRTIVVDPGHGGKEVGAIGPSGLMEKDLTLQIARRVARQLEQQLGVRTILTRDDDQLVSLEQRTAIANRYQADLFLSIHLNAAVIPNARGSETYFLSLDATDDAARMAAERENATPAAGGGDLDFILWDLAHTRSVRESSRFAEMVQGEMNRINGITNRGVKQAPFKVLVGAAMPAALVELAFISNPEEESKLGSGEFQQQLADAVVSAVRRYKQEVEGTGAAAASASAAPAAPGAER